MGGGVLRSGGAPVAVVWRATGEGPPAIIQGPAWGPRSEYLRLTLAPLLPGFRVVTFDPRNVGDSPRVDDPSAQATEHLVADLEALRERLGYRRFLLLGHSHGGFVAMGYAARHPDRVRGLVLLNTGLRQPHPDGEARAILEGLAADPRRAEAVSLFREARGLAPAVEDDAELARWLRRLMPLYFHDLDALARFQAAVRESGPPSAAALRRMPPEPEAWVEEGLGRIRAPTLLLTGRHDVAAPPAEAYRIAGRIAGAEVAVLERCAHHPWVEDPEAFSRTLRRFLQRLPAP